MNKMLCVFFVLCLVSCEKGGIYDKLDTDFTDNRWMAGSPKTFEFTIDKEGAYDLAVRFSYVAGFQFREIPITVILTDTNGAAVSHPMTLELIDASGKELGDCSGDICDLEQEFESGRRLSPGVYKVAIQHQFPNTFLPNVLGVGFRVTVSKPE